jgi:kynurenine formamidase
MGIEESDSGKLPLSQIPSGGIRVVDLSLDIYDGAPTYPGLAECSVTRTHTVAANGLNISRLTLSTHGTTHLDAPSHIRDDGGTVEQLELEKCVGPAWVIDLSALPPKSLVRVSDLGPAAEHVVPGARILLRFDWDKHYPHPEYFADHPNISLELAHWFAARRISVLGIDTPTPNLDQVVDVHGVLLEAGIVLVEALANLDRFPEDGGFLIVAPLRVVGADGAPLRALALVERGPS